MSPAEIDREVVQRRLRLLGETLDELRPLAPLGPDRLREDPIARAAVERFVQVLVDLAADVSAHIVVARTSAAPATTAEAFRSAAALGLFPSELADQLAAAAGLRNLLVHRYGDIDVSLLSGALDEVLSAFGEYVTTVARWIEESPEDEGGA